MKTSARHLARCALRWESVWSLIFLILLLQFRTLSDALIVMAAFPLALPGAALGLFVTHNPFGFTAFIGVISLGGLVVRNSIILVDYIHERMKHGIPLEEATLEAGERRLRPIFLTTMAAAVGVTPMILSRSTMWSPLASVIAFGLLGSMFFTLVVIPVLFVVVNTKKVSRPAVAAAASIAFLLALATPSQAQQLGVPNDRLSSLGSEQRSITLDEALQLAMKKNSTVRIAEQKAREADAKVVQAKANYFPVVTNETNAIHVGETQALTIPAGSLGTYSSTGPIPSTNVTLAQGEQNSVLSQTTLVQPISQIVLQDSCRRKRELRPRRGWRTKISIARETKSRSMLRGSITSSCQHRNASMRPSCACRPEKST